ncbi:MAG: ATP-binding protein, partial [Lachnospirales bacterium]
FVIIAAVLGFAVLNLSMSKTISDITKLNNAAKKIALGCFDEQIEIKGDDELAQLAESFNDMAKSLSETEKNKQEFLSNIAHDIRSPITSITGFLDAILDGTVPPEKINKYLKIIKSETNRLNKLTNSILDLNKISGIRQELITKDFCIDELIVSTIESINSRTFDKKLSVSYKFEKEGILVNADYDKIQRVLYNLYDNAIKFTNEGGYIETYIYTKKNKAYISITNSGLGLTKEEQKKVFDRLYKTDSSRGIDKTGMGLGLAIVKEFINMHNETISVESKLNKYTKFTFTLKLK